MSTYVHTTLLSIRQRATPLTYAVCCRWKERLFDDGELLFTQFPLQFQQLRKLQYGIRHSMYLHIMESISFHLFNCQCKPLQRSMYYTRIIQCAYVRIHMYIHMSVCIYVSDVSNLMDV
jgi:hypothetical protein